VQGVYYRSNLTQYPNPQPMDGLPTPRRYMAVFAISCGTALNVIDGAIPNVALPTIATDLGISSAAAVLIVSIYQLVLVMTLLPFSALGSQIGLKRLYLYGQGVFILAALLCFFAPSLPLLLAARGLQALGAAAALSVSSALVRSIYPAGQLGRGLGINSVVVASAAALAPILGGFIVAAASWQWVFVATVPLGLLSLALGRVFLPDSPARREPYDLPGALLCALSFGLIVAGLLALAQGQATATALPVAVLGLLIAVIFVRRELREPSPILPVDLLGHPIVALSVLGAFLAFIGAMTFMLSVPFRLQQDFGFSPGEIGAVIVPWPLSMMIVAPIAGMLSDRFHPGLLGGIGMAIATLGMLLLAFLPEGASYGSIAWRMAICGVGYGMFLSPNARLVVSAAPLARAASAGGLISTNRLLAQTLGATLLAGLLNLGYGSDATPALIAAALALCAGICSVARLAMPDAPGIGEERQG
jgi:MFS transporter, DHA2 family, multidrug resistance protein